MRFCSTCGKTIAILNDTDDQFCQNCSPAKKPEKAQPTSNPATLDEFGDTIISVRGNRLILESPEGWLLWSGSIESNHNLHEILKGQKNSFDPQTQQRPLIEMGPLAPS